MSKNSNTMNVAISINEAFIPYAYTMLTSLFENNTTRKIRVFILFGNIPDSSLLVFENLEKKYNQEIQCIQIPLDWFPDSLPRNEEWTVEIYFRLTLQDILPESIDRVLYLDTDTIINKSLDDLYDLDFQGKSIITCKDMSVAKVGLLPKQETLFARHIANGDFSYFNVGVLLLNIDKIRKGKNFDYYMEQILQRLSYIFAPEQDLLNDLFYGDVLYVDETKYDLFAKLAHSQGKGYDWVKENTTIIHYAGRKPWSPDTLRYDTEKIWWEYAKLTPFYNSLLEQTFLAEIEYQYADKTLLKLMQDNENLKAVLQKLKAYLTQQ